MHRISPSRGPPRARATRSISRRRCAAGSVSFAGVGRHGEKVRRPCVECGAFLLCPIVPLIYSDYASSASAQMVQHRLGDFEAHAEALRPRRKRPPQIMQPPAGNI
jgi:hypothetical protein